LTVFAISAKAAQRYRDRKAPAGTKNDQLDAWSCADALRSDGHAWRALVPDDPATQELRLLCRDEVHLIELRTSPVLQLRAALGEYFPAAIRLFQEWTVRAAWSFVVRFPTPAAALEAGRKAWRKFFIEHGLSRGELMTERRAASYSTRQSAAVGNSVGGGTGVSRERSTAATVRRASARGPAAMGRLEQDGRPGPQRSRLRRRSRKAQSKFGDVRTNPDRSTIPRGLALATRRSFLPRNDSCGSAA
jgi:hypothetical protein